MLSDLLRISNETAAGLMLCGYFLVLTGLAARAANIICFC